MAKIQNTINNQINTKGGKKAEADINRVTKAQTRLGQASASAGRQFSSQASGLGGLVSAYAGAAATVFALQQAFAALNRAARAEQTIAGVNALANAVGESGPRIIEAFQAITKSQLSLVESAELLNIGLSAGLPADQLLEFGEIGLKASRALGRDLTDTIQRLIRGVSKLEPELLDELGIFARIEPAAEAYALSVGKVASQLSNFEKRQAFANAVALEGGEKFATIDTSATSSAESLEKLVATLSDIAIEVGGFIASAIQPLVEALGQPVTAIGAFGILTKTVFGTAIRELEGGLGRSISKIDGFRDSVINFVAGAKKSTIQTAKLADETNKLNLTSVRASEANKEEFNSLIRKSRAQEASLADARRLNKIAEEEIKLNKRKILGLLQLEKRTKRQREEVRRLVRNTRSFVAVQTAANARLAATPKLARAAGTALAFLASSFAKVGKTILGVIGLLTTIITVASVIVSSVSAILDAFGVLDPVIEKFERFTRAIADFFNITAEQRKARDVADELKEAGLGTFDTASASAIASIAESTGKSFKAVALEIQRAADGAILLKDATRLTSVLAEEVKFQNEAARGLSMDELEFRKKQNEAANNRLNAQRLSITLLKTLEKGTATTEKLEKSRGAVVALINRLKKSNIALDRVTSVQLERQLNIIDKQLQAQIVINKQRDSLRKEFSAELSNASKLNKFFIRIKDGEKERLKLTTDSLQQGQSRIKQLTESFELGKKALELQRQGIKIGDEQVALANLARDAEQALLGSFVKQIEAAKALRDQLEKTLKKEQDRKAVLDLQLTALKAQNQIALDKQQVNNAVKRLQLQVSLAKAQAEFNKEVQKGIDIQREADNEDLKRRVSDDPLLTEGEKAALNVKIDRASLQVLENVIEKQIAAFKVQAKFEEDAIKKQISLQESLLAEDKDNKNKIQKAADAQLAATNKSVTAQGEQKLAEIKLLEARKGLIKTQLKGFSAHVEGIARVLAADLTRRKELAMADDPGKFQESVKQRVQQLLSEKAGASTMGFDDPIVKELAKLLQSIKDPQSARAALLKLETQNITPQVKSIVDNLEKELDKADFSKVREAIKQATTAQTNLNKLKQQNKTQKEINAAEEKLAELRAKLEELGIKNNTTLEQFNNQIKEQRLAVINAAIAATEASNRFKQAGNEIRRTLRDGFVDGFLQLNDAIIDGTLTLDTFKKGFQGFVSDLIKQIQRIFFTKTIAEPASNALMKMFGLGGNTAGRVGAATASNFVGSSGSLGGGFGGTGLGTIVGTASGGLINGYGSAQRLAAGGSPRDRMPTLLEPGEFVMSRKAVNQAGLPAMQQMNAGGTPPISVNIKNEGTPQEATEAQPRFDVDKIVIDVVTRDLRNNGPIRKSLRGGS